VVVNKNSLEKGGPRRDVLHSICSSLISSFDLSIFSSYISSSISINPSHHHHPSRQTSQYNPHPSSPNRTTLMQWMFQERQKKQLRYRNKNKCRSSSSRKAPRHPSYCQISNASSFAWTLFSTSGSGAGSTFTGCARGQSGHLSCWHRMHSWGSEPACAFPSSESG
jgi:hypothetical protein